MWTRGVHWSWRRSRQRNRPKKCQWHGQIEITKEFIARAKKRMFVADEKIRLAQVALQDAKDEKE